ncbi:hypothetical protein LshimejAT787_0506190 [Lyophyllum shimeji]|uniref:Uncharacterized protein n=1 Tax=Lyophyllum shimeji TaxID=47721 RepID=A0A9P3UL17_LYOSH|nr:hypothetical protein LshimejAT787_0506190 [Lyophyllum shimeji]
MDTSTTSTTVTPHPIPQQPASTSGVKIRIPSRVARLQFIPDEPNISFHRDEIGESYCDYCSDGYDYDEVEARRDMSTYEIQPSGRLVAGSKRVARARENVTVTAGATLVAKEFRFGDGNGADVVAFEGFKSVSRIQPESSLSSPENGRAMETS